ncbi:MAG: hypothetical protein EAY65_01745 [Alphaproteobacteria bacterium]|nr:MAG: hypothetical protein EAY65_01745 [Alphaproteobacteria bacterium]
MGYTLPPFTLCKYFTLCIWSYAPPQAGELVKQGFLKRNPMLNRGGAFYSPPPNHLRFFVEKP